MKTKEELNALKNEISAINDKLAELNEDELKEVTGGAFDINSSEEGGWVTIPETGDSDVNIKYPTLR